MCVFKIISKVHDRNTFNHNMNILLLSLLLLVCTHSIFPSEMFFDNILLMKLFDVIEIFILIMDFDLKLWSSSQNFRIHKNNWIGQKFWLRMMVRYYIEIQKRDIWIEIQKVKFH